MTGLRWKPAKTRSFPVSTVSSKELLYTALRWGNSFSQSADDPVRASLFLRSSSPAHRFDLLTSQFQARFSSKRQSIGALRFFCCFPLVVISACCIRSISCKSETIPPRASSVFLQSSLLRSCQPWPSRASMGWFLTPEIPSQSKAPRSRCKFHQEMPLRNTKSSAPVLVFSGSPTLHRASIC